MSNDIPDELLRMIEEGSSILECSSELSLGFRIQLHRGIEALSKDLHPDAGYYRRAKIALACAYKTLPIWEGCYDVDGTARNILSLSIQCLAGEEPLEELKIQAERFETIVNNIMCSSEDNIVASYAGFSCLSAFETVVYDYDFSMEAKTEKDCTPECWDACFNSSLAISGGATWESVVLNESARKEFLLWYLKVALIETWPPLVAPGEILEH
ncbi:Imm5 family immunity protein [uncultured Pseudoteredinibacter sp.]|uniref:Imm5 family immunity protein n=1 Tax=uncultured Pseudoteredinibacter sp. TaxID=1641701 RepID=UPI0026169A48|nr:Imm5 family immunity protein [uncultured Pseudoteredinibacter sp.]